MRALTALILAASAASPAVAGPQALLDPDAALARSQATGRPILAIAGSTGCVWCKKMAGELASDPAVQEPAGKFVVLLLDTDDSVRWPKWSDRYKVEGEGIPAVFVVRADGAQIYGDSGAPSDLAAFLGQRLEDAGTVLDDAGLAALTNAARTLSRGWRKRDPREVVAEVGKHFDPKNYSAPARQIALIVEQMRKYAEDRLEAAERDLKDDNRKPEAVFEAALAALELRRDYAELPDFGGELTARVEAMEKRPETAAILSQAARVIEAETLYAAGKAGEATEILRSLAAETDAPAAAHAERTIARWAKNGPAPRKDSVDVAAEPGSGGGVSRAATQLRLGKAMLTRDASKARKYFEKAIELAPDSAEATEARKLLER